MKEKIKKPIIVSVIGFLPIFIMAAGDTGSSFVPNPLGETKTIDALLQKIIYIVIQIGLPIIILGIIYTGFLFVTARGNTSQIDKAKKALNWTLLGALIVLGSYVIMELITGTVNAIL